MKPLSLVGVDSVLLAVSVLAATFVAAAPVEAGRVLTALFFWF